MCRKHYVKGASGSAGTVTSPSRAGHTHVANGGVPGTSVKNVSDQAFHTRCNLAGTVNDCLALFPCCEWSGNYTCRAAALALLARGNAQTCAPQEWVFPPLAAFFFVLLLGLLPSSVVLSLGKLRERRYHRRLIKSGVWAGCVQHRRSRRAASDAPPGTAIDVDAVSTQCDADGDEATASEAVPGASPDHHASLFAYQQLQGVVVSRVAAAIEAGTPPSEVLIELFNGSAYLEPCTTAAAGVLGRRDRKVTRGKLAIISYRCVKADGDSFTLSEPAFLSALSAAQRHGVEYLWLDAWSYRKQPPWAEYVHMDFVMTLTTVMAQVDLVIWLPRSRASARGEYQERLWCSFEAAMVQLRNLPVVAAGFAPDAQQRSIAAVGSLHAAPLRCSRVDSAGLARLNAAFYLCIACTTADILMPLMYGARAPAERAISLVLLATSLLAFACLWQAARGSKLYANVVMRRDHGKQVLDIMYAAATRQPMPRRPFARILSTRLPWLPGYDRRDTTVISGILRWFEDVDPEAAASDSSLDALALSTYCHAQLCRAPGDDPTGLTLRQWLLSAGVRLQKNGRIDNVLASKAITGSDPHAALEDDAVSMRWSDQVWCTTLTEPSQGAVAVLWREASASIGRARCAITAPAASPRRSATATPPRTLRGTDDELWVRELYAFGWRFVRGLGARVCINPAGAIATRTQLRRRNCGSRRAADWDLSQPIVLPAFTAQPVAVGFLLLFSLSNGLWPFFSALYWTDARAIASAMVYQAAVNDLLIGLAFTLLAWVKLRWDYRVWCMGVLPPTLRFSGKAEYALLMGFLLGYFLLVNPGALPTNSEASGVDQLGDRLQGWQLRCRWIFLRLPVAATLLPELLLAVAHSIGGVLSYRTCLGCLELLATRFEAGSTLV